MTQRVVALPALRHRPLQVPRHPLRLCIAQAVAEQLHLPVQPAALAPSRHPPAELLLGGVFSRLLLLQGRPAAALLLLLLHQAALTLELLQQQLVRRQGRHDPPGHPRLIAATIRLALLRRLQHLPHRQMFPHFLRSRARMARSAPAARTLRLHEAHRQRLEMMTTVMAIARRAHAAAAAASLEVLPACRQSPSASGLHPCRLLVTAACTLPLLLHLQRRLRQDRAEESALLPPRHRALQALQVLPRPRRQRRRCQHPRALQALQALHRLACRPTPAQAAEVAALLAAQVRLQPH